MTYLIYLIIKAIASLPECYTKPAQSDGEPQEPCSMRAREHERTRNGFGAGIHRRTRQEAKSIEGPPPRGLFFIRTTEDQP